MKKLFSFVLFSLILSVIFISCNKDDAVSSNGSNPTPSIITQTYSSSPNKNIAPNGWTEDILNVNITDGVNAANVSNIKLNLNNLEQVSIQNLRFALAHNGTEVFVIDTPLVATAPGNMINTVLFDSATTSITGQTYPFTGTFRPQRPLSSFLSSEASGNWTLRIYNSDSLRSGVIKSWGITISYNKVQPLSTQIFPTAIGNTWKLEGRDASGNIYGYDTLRITETMLYQGKTLYRLIDYEKPNDTMYVVNESYGAYIWSKFGGSTLGSQLMWKYPVTVGEIYIGGGNGDTVKCLSINETIATPSGTYTGCIKYEIHDMGQIKTYFYVKPGIGIVGIDHLTNGDYERLYYYHLNK